MFSYSVLFAQNTKSGFYLNNVKTQSLKFQFVSNVIVIPLIFNDSDTMRFILDTGLKTTLITKLSSSDSLHLNSVRELTIRGLGVEEDLHVIHSTGNESRMANLNGKNLDCYVLKDNRFDFSAEMGVEIHGLIGTDIFANLIVEIDYDENILHFHDPDFFKFKRKHTKFYERFPLIFHNTKPYLVFPIEMKNGHRFDAKLLIDIGASDALWLFPDSLKNILIPENNRYGYLGKGLNGKIFGHQSRVNSVEIGRHKLTDVTVSFPDTSAIKYSKLQDLQGRNGSVGTEVIRRFNVIFDYGNAQVFLKPNGSFKYPFNFNMTGITAEAPFANIRYYLVSDVRAGSPAEICGIKKGDEIQSVNFNDATKYSLTELNSLMHKKEGSVLRLTLVRNGELLKVKLKLVKDL